MEKEQSTSMRITKKSIIILLCLVMLWSSEALAQQVPLYSLYMFEKSLVNSAYAGINNQVVGTLLYKNKFVGFEGAPQTQILAIHAPIQSKFMGVGLKVVNDNIGSTRATSFAVMYSYHLGFASGKLSLGLEGGLINYNTDFDQMLKTDQIDAVIPVASESLLLPSASTGLFYLSDKMHFGVSLNHLIPSKLDKSTFERDPRAQLSKHLIVINGYDLELGRNLKLKPSWLLKYVASAPVQLDLNISAEFMETILFGATYRTGDALVFLMRYSHAKQIHIAYAYDYTISKLSTYSGGSHEVAISYTFELMEPAMKKIIDPRYYY